MHTLHTMNWLKTFINSFRIFSVFNLEQMAMAHLPRVSIKQVSGEGDIGKFWAELHYKGKIASCEFVIEEDDLVTPSGMHEFIKVITERLILQMSDHLIREAIRAENEQGRTSFDLQNHDQNPNRRPNIC